MKRLIMFLPVALIATNVLAGYTYHFKSVAAGPRGEMTTTGVASVDGSKMRIVFENGDKTLFTDGSIVVSDDGGKNLTVIDPTQKSYFAIKLDEILDSTKRAKAGPRLSFTNPKVDVKDEGDGGEIEGFPTHKYEVDSSYDVIANMMGREMTNHIVMRTEIWTTEKLSAGLTTFVQLRGFRMGIDELDKLMDAHPVKGFPLKQIVTGTSTPGGGTPRTWTTTTTVTGVQEGAAVDIAVPEGYSKVEMPRR